MAVSPDDRTLELWKYRGKMGVEFLMKLYNMILDSEKMTYEWKKSVLILMFKT